MISSLVSCLSSINQFNQLTLTSSLDVYSCCTPSVFVSTLNTAPKLFRSIDRSIRAILLLVFCDNSYIISIFSCLAVPLEISYLLLRTHSTLHSILHTLHLDRFLPSSSSLPPSSCLTNSATTPTPIPPAQSAAPTGCLAPKYQVRYVIITESTPLDHRQPR